MQRILCRKASAVNAVRLVVALDPTIATEQTQNYVDVETSTELTRGMTVVDRLNVAGNDRNKAIWPDVLKSGLKAKVVWTMDIARRKQALFKSLR